MYFFAFVVCLLKAPAFLGSEAKINHHSCSCWDFKTLNCLNKSNTCLTFGLTSRPSIVIEESPPRMSLKPADIIRTWIGSAMKQTKLAEMGGL